MPESVRQLATAVKCVLVLTIVLGIGYPLLVLGVGQLGLQRQAGGSLITTDGRVVASALIGQGFAGDEWFQPRPSGGDYDALASGGSNAGPNDAELVAKVWGHDLAVEGIVVEPLHGIDDLPAAVREFGPGPGRRLGHRPERQRRRL